MAPRLSSVLTITLLSLLLGACAGPMGGREGGPNGPGGPGQGFNGTGPGERGGMGGMSVVEQLREQLRETESALQLTPKQAVLWDAYQESVSALMADQLRLAPHQVPHQAAPRQIEAKAATVRNRLAALEQLIERADALYQSLNDEQKQVADQRLVNTVPELYSSISCQGAGESGSRDRGGMGPGSGGMRGQGGTGGMGGMGGGGRF